MSEILTRMAEMVDAARAEYDAQLADMLAILKKDYGIDRPLNKYGQLEVTPEEFARLQVTPVTSLEPPQPKSSPLDVTIPIVVVRGGPNKLKPYEVIA